MKRPAWWAIPRLRRRDGDWCGLCGNLINFGLPVASDSRDGASVDHIVPLAAGGTSALDNLQLAHRRCNQRKGATYQGAADLARLRNLPRL